MEAAMDTVIKEMSSKTPDPERSSKNLERLLLNAPGVFTTHGDFIEIAARLFSYSQFLADYCINHPTILEHALDTLHEQITREKIIAEITGVHPQDKAAGMRLLRDIKKRYMLRITLRDIAGVIGLDECMAELSALAEAVIGVALDLSQQFTQARFGMLKDNPFCVIALGKLGAGELNYSSDIDIMTVYESEDGESDGIEKTPGTRVNKVSPHEYYCRLTETLSGLIQTTTEDSIAYRVDLRLRPDGRKGELSLSLDSYSSYYEAWGKTWERMALIRARPVAGDMSLGQKFLDAIDPFVWKKSTDYYDIEEIRELKRKIDSIFDANDIKRGYGGIREIEFFIQTFQLLYGGERSALRTPRLAFVLDELLKEGFLSTDDVTTLSESYRFLRRVEHVLQMKDDLQTHSLPADPHELEVFSRKMQPFGEKEFTSELRLRRHMVRDMYNSLLGGEDTEPEIMVFLEDELTDDEIRDFLAFKGFENPGTALKNLKAISEQISLGKTIRERTMLRKTIPLFLDRILKYKSRDRLLSMFVTFIEKIGGHESYLELLSSRDDTVELITSTFVNSTYLTRSMLSLENLEGLFEYPDIRIDYSTVKERLSDIFEHNHDPINAIREFRASEEMRAGLLFLKGFYSVDELTNTLSMLAEIIVRATLRYLSATGANSANRRFAVVSFGRFGSRELNVGSDLDLVFISDNPNAHRLASELIKFLSDYTERGIAYQVDMRLRPDGSKGILVNDIAGYRNYYLKNAHPWEIQALLKARPIAGDKELLRAFHQLKKEIIAKRGVEISGTEIKEMRKRIIKEVSKESAGYDIKLGPGGIEELQFLIQYLQLKNAATLPGLITHNTTIAIKRLTAHGIVDRETEQRLLNAYRFLRTVETLLRLNQESVLKPDSGLAEVIAGFFEFSDTDALLNELESTRRKVLETAEAVYL